MALRAGAELVDMEFVQFHPTVLLSPLALRGNQGVPHLARVLFRGVMLNAKGERFLERYDPERMELTDRDIMARAIHREVTEGRGSPNGGVWLDVSHMGDAEVEAGVRKFAPKWVFRGINLLEYGLDLRRVPLEIGTFAHFWCGGIKVGPGMGTRVNGLFASGEAIGGVFGANRLPGDALVQAVVTGKTAGISAAEYAKGSSSPGEDGESVKAEAHRALSFLRDGKGARPHRIRKSLRRLMMQKVGVVRNEGGLKEALAELARIREEDLPRIALRTKSRKYNREWVESLELQNMLEVAEMTANPALLRYETRGNHEREDYVETSRDWLKNIVIRSSGGKLELEEIPCSFPKIAPE
jgi:succinate dehydrogenase/fumarate reductase flavoprotein subunit